MDYAKITAHAFFFFHHPPTSVFYPIMNSINLISLLMISLTTHSLHSQTIASFENANELRNWDVVNDSVMGGISTSRFEQTSDGNLLFQGNLSLENNGGFVSIRNRPRSFELQNVAGFNVKARGDGRTYFLDLRVNGQRTSGSFRAAFPTQSGQWTETFLPVSKFVRQSFGRPYPDVPLDPRDINSLGFTLSDKKPGPFKLEVAYVKAASEPSPSKTADRSPNAQPQGPRALVELAISRGVPLFNQGNPDACAAVYEITCRALLESNTVPESAQTPLLRALDESALTSSDTRKAWILRSALDEVLPMLPKD